MRPSQLGQWAALMVLDPWDERRADLRAGVVAATIANVNRDSKKRPKPFQPSEFVLQFGLPPPDRPTTARQLFHQLVGHRIKPRRP